MPASADDLADTTLGMSHLEAAHLIKLTPYCLPISPSGRLSDAALSWTVQDGERKPRL